MSTERTMLTDEQVEEVAGGRVWTKGDQRYNLLKVVSDVTGEVYWADWQNSQYGTVGVYIDKFCRKTNAGKSDAECLQMLLEAGVIRTTPNMEVPETLW